MPCYHHPPVHLQNPFYLVHLKLCTHKILTSHSPFPLALGNHHSTFCDFDYSKYFV